MIKCECVSVEELSRPGPVEAWVRLPLAPGSGLGSASARNPTRHDALAMAWPTGLHDGGCLCYGLGTKLCTTRVGCGLWESKAAKSSAQ